MRNKQQNIQAFTIVELLTVMAVSSIVITIGVLMYGNANKAFNTHDEDLKQEYKLNAFYTSLNYYVFISDSVKNNGSNDYILFVGDKDLILQVEDDQLIFIEDTLLINEGESNFELLNKSSKKVKRINFSFLFENIEFNWGFEKKYGIIQ